MQDGAGTTGLKNMFNVIIPDRFFKEQLKKIKSLSLITFFIFSYSIWTVITGFPW